MEGKGVLGSCGGSGRCDEAPFRCCARGVGGLLRHLTSIPLPQQRWGGEPHLGDKGNGVGEWKGRMED